MATDDDDDDGVDDDGDDDDDGVDDDDDDCNDFEGTSSVFTMILAMAGPTPLISNASLRVVIGVVHFAKLSMARFTVCAYLFNSNNEHDDEYD